MPTTANLNITPEQLSHAAQIARDLNDFLEQAGAAKVMPILMGFDLDYLADQFDEAAELLTSKLLLHRMPRGNA